MKTELQILLKKHKEEKDKLCDICEHPNKLIKIFYDNSCAGRGIIYPGVHVICRNCGIKKIIYRDSDEIRIAVKKTMKRQGFKDERLNFYFELEEELEPNTKK